MADLYLKLGLMLVSMFVERSKNKEEMQKLYNDFLKQLSVHSSVANKQSMKVEELLLAKQEEVKKKNETN